MSELQQAISEMRNMRESYDQLGAAAEAYNTGKTELAANITSKGVQASATETLPELAEKVAAISQETYEINGGEMYAKQLFGSLETPNYWNLYDVLTQLLSDGRLVQYGGILLAEYYRGYGSLALAGAGAGGAYVVSDLDENGQFKMYTEDTTHTWATEFDGHGNRWVAYCFADEYHDFSITDINTSPRSVFVGRKVGYINMLTNGRISEIYAEKAEDFYGLKFQGNYTNQWNKRVVYRCKDIIGTSSAQLINGGNVESIFVETAGNIDNTSGLSGAVIRRDTANLNSVIVKCASVIKSEGDGTSIVQGNGATDFIIITPKLSAGRLVENVRKAIFLGLEESYLYQYLPTVAGNSTTYIYIGYDTNDKNKSVSIRCRSTHLTDIELQNGYCKPLIIREETALTKANVQAHIFDHLGVNDLSTGAVTIMLANAVLNLFTQEEIDAVVERTNITIVGA